MTAPAMRVPGWLWRCALGLVLLGMLALALLVWRDRGAPLPERPTPLDSSPARVAQGAYLARLGNCAGCHTDRGGLPYAGGRAIETPFGSVHASNLTSDPATGLGDWTSDQFWQAMHEGRSRDGRLLSPAFPYANFTRVSRDDSDALFAYLRSLAPVVQANRPDGLRFPYNTRAALAVWRALYFRPAAVAPAGSAADAKAGEPPGRLADARWQRGAYLVEGLAHCGACHGRRNALGATDAAAAFGGALMPDGKWFAPSLADATQAGVMRAAAGGGGPDPDAVVRLLRTGTASHGVASGPMAQVVAASTQHFTDADLDAVVVYLAALPAPLERPAPRLPADPAMVELGRTLYRDHCIDCHGSDGQGAAGVYPALAGNRTVLMASTTNLARVIVAGGFAPTTAGNPRPYGMPPFGPMLRDLDIAALATYVRNAWGNQGGPVSTLDVARVR